MPARADLPCAEPDCDLPRASSHTRCNAHLTEHRKGKRDQIERRRDAAIATLLEIISADPNDHFDSYAAAAAEALLDYAETLPNDALEQALATMERLLRSTQLTCRVTAGSAILREYARPQARRASLRRARRRRTEARWRGLGAGLG